MDSGCIDAVDGKVTVGTDGIECQRIGSVSLADAAVGDVLTVSHVLAHSGAPEWARQLEDIGFIAGERVVLMARGAPGGDPLVVRVGLSTFALRLAEAACVRLASAPAEIPG